MQTLITGIFAHVDAGKTTLSEALLFQSGVIRKFGRVDSKDSFLDNFSIGCCRNKLQSQWRFRKSSLKCFLCKGCWFRCALGRGKSIQTHKIIEAKKSLHNMAKQKFTYAATEQILQVLPV